MRDWTAVLEGFAAANGPAFAVLKEIAKDYRDLMDETEELREENRVLSFNSRDVTF